MRKYDYLIVGAGFAGAVMAERIASQLNKKVIVVEKRSHIGGNAYDEIDEHGILIHRYGPHIFHTNSREVFEYLSNFTEWRLYEHKVLAMHNGELYPIPINMETINKLYNKNFKVESEVKAFYEEVREKRAPILNSEDIIVNQIGSDLFEIFFMNYSKKQWGIEPKDLSPSVCGRIPVRTNSDCRYFTDRYQFMPKDGYAKMFERMLKHKNIEVMLNTDFKEIINSISWEKMIYTGPIDYYFDYEFGKLPYRSIRFEYENNPVTFYQQTAQVNYVDLIIPYNRVIEHKYLSGQESGTTTISREYPQTKGEPFYPVPTEESRILFKKYKEKGGGLKNVVFCGRLAEYQYYNMDQVVAQTLKRFAEIPNG